MSDFVEVVKNVEAVIAKPKMLRCVFCGVVAQEGEDMVEHYRAHSVPIAKSEPVVNSVPMGSVTTVEPDVEIHVTEQQVRCKVCGVMLGGSEAEIDEHFEAHS